MAQKHVYASIDNPENVTYEDIEALKDAVSGLKLAKKFAPAVSMAKCSGLPEVQERLRVALQRAEGEMRDLQALGTLMHELRATDQADREALMALFGELETFFLHHQDQALNQQLQMETITSNYQGRLGQYQSMLRQEECPVLVVGQTSSGKSSLLNLFLGADYLPSQLLSCTASVCELSYGERQQATLVFPDGKEKEIPFEEKDKYIYKKEERDQRFQHEAVRLKLDVPFLKSGIVLIDTPGVGESEVMENVLLDYVKKKEAFGFIFVLKCNDAGGVLQRFKNLLRQLADIKDAEGQKKFDPKSVIFVANFWDQVPDPEKQKTKDLIINTLVKEKCMMGFNPARQLFFMNSKFAFNTFKANLISEDYDRLITGIENFFPIGHKRKLEVAYLWFENLIEKAFHTIKAFLAKATYSDSLNRMMSEKTGKELKELFKQVLEIKNEMKQGKKQALNFLKSEVTRFLQSEEAKKEITVWRPGEVPKEEIGDTWILIEERLDKAIDKKIATSLENWESDHKHFSVKSKELLNRLDAKMEIVKLNIKAIRKASLTDNDDIFDSLEEIKEETNHPVVDQIGMNMAASSKYGYKVQIMQRQPQNILDSFTSKTANIMRSSSVKYDKIKQENMELYKSNKASFMCNRAQAVLTYTLGAGKDIIDDMVENQMKPVLDYIENQIESVKQSLMSDESLLETVGNDSRSKKDLKRIYEPLKEKIDDLFERSLEFRVNHLLIFQFLNSDIDYSGDQNRPTRKQSKRIKWSKCGMFGEISWCKIPYKVVSTSEKTYSEPMVTLKRFSVKCTQTDKNDAILLYQDIFYHLQNLGSSQRFREQCLPTFVGVAQNGPSFVFEGHLRTVESVAFPKHKSLIFTRNHASQTTIPILNDLAKGLEFMHLRRFVHFELSLSSVLANKSGRPVLVNLFDPLQVPFPPREAWDSTIGNYVYMPPEVFPKRCGDGYQQGELYTSAADVYALGMITMELVTVDRLFDTIKEAYCIQDMITKGTLQTELKHVINSAKDVHNIRDKLIDLCLKCIEPNPEDRISIGKWNEEWRDMKENVYTN